VAGVDPEPDPEPEPEPEPEEDPAEAGDAPDEALFLSAGLEEAPDDWSRDDAPSLVELPSRDDAPSVLDVPPDDPVESDPPSDAAAAFVLDALAELRSFLAQPEPLKWIDGAENAFRTGAASQTGHSVGPASSIRWIASKRCPFGQRYS
jgi:hypothetical protein